MEEKAKTRKKIPPVLSAVLYILSAALIIFYVWVLVISLDYSETSDAYQKFYVTKDLRHYADDAELGGYVADNYFYYVKDGTYKNQADDWSDPDDTGSWAKSETSGFFIYVSDTETPYQLEINADMDEGYRNDLYVNDMHVGALIFEGSRSVTRIDSRYLKKGINKFQIRMDMTSVEEKEKTEENPVKLSDRKNIHVCSLGLFSRKEE